MVARPTPGVADLLPPRHDDAAVTEQHARSAQRELTVTRLARPPAGGLDAVCRDRAVGPTPVEHVAVVRHQHDGAGVAAGGVEQVGQVGDVVQAPPGAVALTAVVEGVVDGVEHDAHHGPFVGEGLGERLGQPAPGRTGDVGLVHEQGRAPVPAPEGGEPLDLAGLVADAGPAGQQACAARAGDRGHRRDRGAATFGLPRHLDPRPLGELLAQLRRDRRAHPVDDHHQRCSPESQQRDGHLLQHLFDQQGCAGHRRRRVRDPVREEGRERGVLVVAAVTGRVEHGAVCRGDHGVVDALPRPHGRERAVDPPALGDLRGDGRGDRPGRCGRRREPPVQADGHLRGRAPVGVQLREAVLAQRGEGGRGTGRGVRIGCRAERGGHRA